MNFLNQIQIQNYKCFENQTIPIRRLTAFCGANSSGKSSVIQSILITRSVIDELKRNPQGMEKLDINNPYMLRLRGPYDILKKGSSSDDFSFTYTFTYLEKKYSFKTIAGINPDIKIESYPKNADIKNTSLANKEFYYLNAERIGPRLQYDIFNDSFLNVGWQGEHTVSTLITQGKSLKVNDSRLSQEFLEGENRSSLLIDQAQDWMQYIIPGIDIFTEQIPQLNKGMIMYNDNIPNNVGFGISYVLPIIVTGLIAKEGSIMIVENPEAHLHPSGQSRIGQFLGIIAASGVQVILETHSEHVLNGLRLGIAKKKFNSTDCIFNFFHKEKKETIISQIEITPEGDLTDFPLGFFDQSESDLIEILRLRKL